MSDRRRRSLQNKAEWPAKVAAAHEAKQAPKREQRMHIRGVRKLVAENERQLNRTRPKSKASLPDARIMSLAQITEWSKALMRAEMYDWTANARGDQLPPPGSWKIWLMLCGRGFGKTRTAAEYVREACMKTPGIVVAAIAKDHRALRDVILEGESGLVACTPPEHIKKIHRGLGDVSVEFMNGSKVICYTAGEPDAVRGQSFALVWGDEFASWPKNKADDMLEQARMCLRRSPIGSRVILTTTPKRLPHVVNMVKLAEDPEEEIAITRGTSRDNPVLTPEWHKMMERKLGGTRLGRQELLGELVMDVDNALWDSLMIGHCAWDPECKCSKKQLEELNCVCDLGPPAIVGAFTGVDPSGSKDGDATGIVTVGWTKDKKLVVLENMTTKGYPGERYRAACMSAFRCSSSEIWYESAYGGDSNAYGIQQAWKDCQREGLIPDERPCPPTKKSTITGDKAKRAGPVVNLYESQANRPDLGYKIWHVPPTETNGIPGLEDEMLSWSTEEKKSPNAIDALVHAVRAIMTRLGLDPASISTPASKHSTRRINKGYNPYGSR